MTTSHDPAPYQPIACTPKGLGLDRQQEAADIAVRHNPLNHPHLHRLSSVQPGIMTRENIAVMTTRYWRSGGVALTVGFLDTAVPALRKRILSHMNAWASARGRTANIVFTETDTDPQVRIAFGRTGHWSYIGTDILAIAPDQPTMNLQEFTMDTPDSEFHRVVRHETGHTLGCPHEHMRADLVARVDPAKATKFYYDTQGWSAQQVKEQVLTPLDDGMLWKTTMSDDNSIMCYQIPASITTDGKPIVGGTDIDQSDADFIAMVYPAAKAASPAAARAMAAPVAAPAAAAAPIASAAPLGADDRISLALPSGETLRLPRDVTQKQLATVLAALKG